MQTFLPDPSFARSAAVLDDRRLGKQRVEVLQILRAGHVDDYGWANHPAVLMWRGHTRALVAYGIAVVEEWCRRGRADTTRAPIVEFAFPSEPPAQTDLDEGALPPWLGWAPLHRSHQSALLRKDAAHYGRYFPGVPSDLPYAWPPAPAGPPPARPFSAWVVRAAPAEGPEPFLDGGFVAVDPRLAAPGATPKQRRQVERFRGMLAGEAVAVPTGASLVCGALGDAPPDGGLRRPVRWARTIPRTGLRRPYQLQDPQTVFALRGEPAAEEASVR